MLDSLLMLSAVAMAAPGGGGGGADGGPAGILGSPFVLVILIAFMFYFLLYKPEKKKREEREKLLKSLEKGDEVMTAGGIYGKVTALTDQSVTIEIAAGVRVKINRQYVTSVGGIDESKDKDKEKLDNGKDKKK